MSDTPIVEFLDSLGLTGEAATEARRILETAGLTTPRKQRIATSKTTLAHETIDRHLQRLCHNCRPRALPDGRQVVPVPPPACAGCGGSNNGRAVREMVAACRR